MAGLAGLLAAIPATAVGVVGHGASGRQASRTVRAVITVRSGTRLPVTVPGGRVLDVLPAVRSEVVSVPTSEVRRIATDHRVAGVSPDRTGHVAGSTWSAVTSTGVYAPATVGGDAGQPGAGAGVTVALLDTGVDDTAALNRASGRLVDAVDLSGLPSGQPARTTGQFTDGYGHGTFLASLIAGGPVPGSSGHPIGVAPGATVDVVKVAGDDGTTSLWQVLAGLNWVATHARSVQVVNLSFAVQRPTYPAYGADPLSTAVQLVRAAGVTVVAAAGNTPGEVGDPGLTPQALTVGAADITNGTVASFSGSGDVDGVTKPDLVASGVSVLGAMSPDTEVAQQNPSAWQSNGLFRGSGTSESTAITSGAAALLLAEHPSYRPVDVKAALRTMATPLPDPRAGTGLLSLAGEPSGAPGHGHGHGHGGFPPGHAVRAGRSAADTGRSAGRFGSDSRSGSHRPSDGHGPSDNHGQSQGHGRPSDPTGESGFDLGAWMRNAWLDGRWLPWLASSWSASSWSASSWSASSWSASSWSASSWSASSWSASSWSASSWSSFWGDGP